MDIGKRNHFLPDLTLTVLLKMAPLSLLALHTYEALCTSGRYSDGEKGRNLSELLCGRICQTVSEDV
jgi:hypothetical protein